MRQDVKVGLLATFLLTSVQIPASPQSKRDDVSPSQFWLRTVRWYNRKQDIDFAVVEQIERRFSKSGAQWLRSPLWTLVDGIKVDFPRSTLAEIQNWPPNDLPIQNSPDVMSVRVDRVLWALFRGTPQSKFPARDRLLPEATVSLVEKSNGRQTLRYLEPEGASSVQLIGTAEFNRQGELTTLRLSGKDVPLPNGTYTAEFTLTQVQTDNPPLIAHSPTAGEIRPPEMRLR
jgi:hypothetical protein